MKPILILALLAFGSPWCPADDLSGPNHSTIRRTAWGTLFYDPVAMGSHQYESKVDEVRIKSSAGEVKVLGSDVNGYRLSFGNDLLTIKTNFSDLEIRWQEKSWTLRSQNARHTLISNAPQDTVVFERNANTFTIKGAKGFVTVNTNPGVLSIKSSAGSATVTNYLGSRSFSGVALDQIPYLGRGVFISFHGVGILLDMNQLFPTPEVAEWNEWKPVIGQPFEANAPR
ncbi:MAG: hypothetical protein Q8K67_09585 [Geothrix sp.]|nr:hypothetical protein [Geothrix sp.]